MSETSTALELLERKVAILGNILDRAQAMKPGTESPDTLLRLEIDWINARIELAREQAKKPS